MTAEVMNVKNLVLIIVENKNCTFIPTKSDKFHHILNMIIRKITPILGMQQSVEAICVLDFKTSQTFLVKPGTGRLNSCLCNSLFHK